ncbi:MAG: DUF6186 family protein [Ilumatobacteraceae bacterium]
MSDHFETSRCQRRRHAVRSRPAQFGLLLSWWWIGVHSL